MTTDERLEKLQTTMDDISKVLAGDDYGNDGLVKQHKDLKKIFYELRDQVKKHAVVGTVIAFIFSSLITLIGIFG